MKRRLPLLVAIATLLLNSVTPGVYAAEITDRSLTLSNAAPGESANYTLNFTVPSGTVIRSMAVEICEQASSTCDVPAGFDASLATLLNQPTGFGDASGWSVDTSDTSLLRMNNSTNAQAPGAAQSVTFGSVINPTTTNMTFFARITTYANDNYTDEIDSGVVALSTSESITVTGFVPPILTFCVGVTISGDCSTASGNNIDLGTFSPSVTASATSQMRASTNAGDGYVITTSGTTLNSGTNSITALSSPTTSQTGQSQFGVNLRDNNTPNVGNNPTGPGSGTYAGDYGITDQFTFNSGDVIASATGPTNPNTFTVSYITNIDAQQAAGNYTTTLTYICTATF